MKFILNIFLIIAVGFCQAQPFTTIWDTNINNDNSNQIILSTHGKFNYYYEKIGNPSINGSGQAGIPVQSQTTITFPTPGVYKLEITPLSIFRIYGNTASANDRKKLIELTQWGNVNWHPNLDYMFYNLVNLKITATDIPDFSGVENMTRFFMNCKSLTTVPNMNDWDVSNVNNMEFMFAYAISFNENIGDWDTSNVSNMASMFEEADVFNQDISGWDVSQVYNMKKMFKSAVSFNQEIGSWDMSNCIYLDSMFENAISFNGDIGNWDASNFKTMDSMFESARAFNQNIGSWDVSNAEQMVRTFAYASVFNQDIGNWDTANVYNMGGMFEGASAFNQDISGWDVSKVVKMNGMFKRASSFNQDIGNWNVSVCRQMIQMFEDATSFNMDIGSWDVSEVDNMYGMFLGATLFNKDIGNWDTSKVTNMSNMFSSATSFNQNISGWDVSKVSTMFVMFASASSFNQNIGSWTLKPGVNLKFALNDTGLSCENYGLTLKGWAENPDTPSNITLHAANLYYSDVGQIYRDQLTNEKNWYIMYDYHVADCNMKVEDFTAKEDVLIYPNPTSNLLHIKISEGLTLKSSEVYNMSGKLILKKNSSDLDVNFLEKGVYVLKIIFDNGNSETHLFSKK